MNEFIARNGLIAQSNSTITGSLTVTNGIIASSITGSMSGTSSFAASSSYAATSSYASNFSVANTLTATTLVVNTISSSVTYSSGSNVFGNSLSNTQAFTGSLQVTGSTHYLLGNVGVGTTSPSYNLDVTGTGRFTGALTGTSATFSSNVNVTAANALNEGLAASVIRQNGSSGNNGLVVDVTNTPNAYIADFRLANSSVFRIGTTGALSGTSATFSSLTVDNNQNGSTWIIAKNQNAGSGAAAGLLMTNNTGDLGAISLLSSGNSPANAMFIRTLSTNSLILGTNSTANLTIASGGAATFSSSVTATDVEATNQFITSGGNLRIVNSGGQVGMNWTSASGGDLYFRTASTERLRITSTGNVGIGTTSPNYALDVYSTSSSNARINITGTTNFVISQYTNSSGAFYIGIDDSAGANFTGTAYARVLYSAGAYPMVFTVNSVERMRIQSNGYVAIGSTSANAPLDVTSVSSTSSGIQQWSYNSAPTAYRLQLNTIVSSGLVKYSYDMLNNSTAYNNTLVLDRGNVGIGTASPARRLQVEVGSTAQGGQNWSHSGGTVFARLGIVNPGVDNNTEFGSASNNDLVFLTVNTERMRITSGGNVGIGTSSPSAKLFVTGSTNVVGIQGSGSAAPLMYVDGSNGRLFEVTDDLSDSLFSVNTIAGLPVIEAFANNCVTLGQYGGHQLKVTSTSIAGGKCSTASGTYSFIGGGICNTASGNCSTIGGGNSNISSNTLSTISGGRNHTGSGYGSTIGGGIQSTSSGTGASVLGGETNTASGNFSSVGGGLSNISCNNSSTVAGGRYNCAFGVASAIAGGEYSKATGNYSFVGGGSGTTASAYMSVAVGGYGNLASGDSSFVGGGGRPGADKNTASGAFSAVVGGCANTASGAQSTVGGGWNNNAVGIYSGVSSGRGNVNCGPYSTISGGYANSIGSLSCFSAIASGYGNISTGNMSFIGGGQSNTASGACSTIGGGYLNQATGCYTFVGGGGGAFGNFACGAFSVAVGGNSQRSGPGAYTVIVGGNSNCACCNCASVVGGSFNNAIGQGSFIGAGTSNTIGAAFTNSSILGCGLTAAASTTTYTNALSKTSGTFRIDHPDPSKTSSKYLQHSFVESPTRGDNIYRYKITTCNCEATLLLPDYYKFLNENDQVWVSPICHFGSAYGIVDSCQTCITFTSNCDGDYNVLLIGTRKDIDAKNGFLGVEVWKQ